MSASVEADSEELYFGTGAMRAMAIDELNSILYLGNDNGMGIQVALATLQILGFFFATTANTKMMSVAIDQFNVTYWGTSSGSIIRASI
jgi:hypothetical protein